MSWPRCINADIAISPTHLLNVFGNTNLSGNVYLGNNSMMFVNGSNVGIGTTTPQNILNIKGADATFPLVNATNIKVIASGNVTAIYGYAENGHNSGNVRCGDFFATKG